VFECLKILNFVTATDRFMVSWVNAWRKQIKL